MGSSASCTVSARNPRLAPTGRIRWRDWLLGTDGNFYGPTIGGGEYGGGTVFKITPQGTVTTLHSFSGLDGDFPVAPLIQAVNGNFYGTTLDGGLLSLGTVFELSATGTESLLHSFARSPSGATSSRWRGPR